MDLSPGIVQVPSYTGLSNFDLQVFTGAKWLSLNDHLNFIVADGTLENSRVQRRRFTVNSSQYDGDFEVHSVLAGTEEQITIDVIGQDQNMVTENYLELTEAFSQSLYNVRVIMDNHQETWRCFPAEWQADRGRIQAHNVRMQVKLSVPRFPKVTYEVIN